MKVFAVFFFNFVVHSTTRNVSERLHYVCYFILRNIFPLYMKHLIFFFNVDEWFHFRAPISTIKCTTSQLTFLSYAICCMCPHSVTPNCTN